MQRAEPDVGALLAADVARYPRHSDDLPGGIGDGGQHDRYLDHGPVLADPLGLVRLHQLAAGDGVLDVALGAAVRGGDQHVDMAADHLGRGIAVEPLGRRVPAGDHPVQGLADHGVVRGLDDRGQPRRDLGGLPLFGHVADGGHDEDAVVGLDGGQRDLGRERAAVAAAAGQFLPRAHGPGPRAGHVAAPQGRMPGPDGVGDQDLHRGTDEFLAGVPEQALGLGVHQDDAPVAGHAHHRVGRRVEEPDQQLISQLRHRCHLVGFGPGSPPG